MTNLAQIEALIPTVTAIVQGIIKAAPAIAEGIADAEPYVQAIIGLISGTNVTQDQLDEAIARIEAESAKFQKPLDA